ncbi:Smad nuclear-interacting protein 1 [Actinomortierella ambigua]|nr:Smad nuclear-interacting protein 1 [Actinomortierella ambigua]
MTVEETAEDVGMRMTAEDHLDRDEAVSTFRSGKDGAGPPGKEVWGAKMIEEEEKSKKPVIAEEDKEKPNFGLSGALAEETNTVNGTVLKYNEPPEARKPSKRWRLYVFKDGKEINVLHIHRQSAFLFGRDRNVADVAVDHPSCSKQHAVLQFRQIVETDQLGQTKRATKPFIIDLESANGTFVNGSQVPPTRYYELKLSDVLKFGASTREYVLLHEDVEDA